MTGTRLMLPVLAALVCAAPADAANLFGRKGKSDARVRQLADTLRSDPDEKKRRAAVAELKEADPRTQADVIPALVGTLQRDPSAGVRADAAEAIGSFRIVFPIAGVALEAAAEADPAPAVRDTAMQALWEYHIIGYRSPKGADGIAGQTPEPPLARPALPRPAAVVPSPAATVVPVSLPSPTTSADTVLPPISSEPPVTAMEFNPTPVSVSVPSNAIRVVISALPPLHLNATAEPPIAEPLDVAPAPRVVVLGGPVIDGVRLPPPDFELTPVVVPATPIRPVLLPLPPVSPEPPGPVAAPPASSQPFPAKFPDPPPPPEPPAPPPPEMN